MDNQYGKVIWLTGLSSSGKSTLAKKIQSNLRNKGIASVLLDGDQVREAVGDFNCGHDHDSRIINAYRISRLANMISRQGILVIVATMSLYHEIHHWNRKNLLGYFEVFIKADMETLKRRDPKKLYQHVASGEAENLPGMDLSPQFPISPDLEIVNNKDLEDVSTIADKILNEAGTNSLIKN